MERMGCEGQRGGAVASGYEGEYTESWNLERLVAVCHFEDGFGRTDRWKMDGGWFWEGG